MHTNACLISILQLIPFQGFAVTLPYCFLNTEIKNVVKSRWARFQVNRMYLVWTDHVEMRCAGSGTSLAGLPIIIKRGGKRTFISDLKSVRRGVGA